MKGGLKCSSMENGVQSVMTSGDWLTLMLSVLNLGSDVLWRLLCLLALDKELVVSGWMMYNA